MCAGCARVCARRACVCGACAPAGRLSPNKLLHSLSVLRARILSHSGAKIFFFSPDPGKSARYLIPLPGPECPRCLAGAVRALRRKAAEPGAEPAARATAREGEGREGKGGRGRGQGGWEKTCPPRPPLTSARLRAGHPAKAAAPRCPRTRPRAPPARRARPDSRTAGTGQGNGTRDGTGRDGGAPLGSCEA